MMLLSILLTACMSLQGNGLDTGKIEQVRVKSKTLGNTRNVSIWLPPGYDRQPERRYPVFFLHDGQNVFDGNTAFIKGQEWRADEVAAALINSGAIPPMIVVGVDNMGMERADEYLPFIWKPNAETVVGGRADHYTTFLADELKPWLQQQYRIDGSSKRTAVGGSSFGGIISLYQGMKRPDVFGKVMAMSPSLWVGDQGMNRLFEANRPKKFKLWMDIGTAEGKDAVEHLDTFKKTLVRTGWKEGADFLSVVEPGAMHNELAWSRRLMAAMLFLFAEKSR